MKKLILLYAFVFLNLTALANTRVESGAEYQKFIGQDQGCSVIWRISKTKAELSLQSLCQTKPLSEQLPLIESTLKVLVSDENVKLSKDSYTLSICCFDEIDREITLAAYRSPKWSSVKGFALNNDSAGTVTEIINQIALPNNFSKIFKSIGYEVRASKTHRMNRVPAKQTPYFDWLKERGVLEDAILPAHPVVYWKMIKTQNK